MFGAQLVGQWLKANGVRYVFALSGYTINPLFIALDQVGIKIIETRDEKAAAYMADAWARSTGQPGVCMVTATAGHGNMLPGLMGALDACSPVIAISGNMVPADVVGRGAIQDINHVDLARPICKWAHIVASSEDLQYSLVEAFRQAQFGRKGPVSLTIPLSIQESKLEENIPDHMFKALEIPAPTTPNKNAIVDALKLLHRAKKPVIVAGAGVWWARAWDELKSFAERTNLPVFVGTKAIGCLADDHPLCFGITLPTNEVAFKSLQSADIVLLIGRRLDWELDPNLLASARSIAQGAKIIQIDIEAEEIGRNRPVNLGIVADCKMALESLIEEATKYPDWEHKAWLKQLGEWRDDHQRAYNEIVSNKIKPPYAALVWQRVGSLLPENSSVVVDGGVVTQFVFPAIKIRKPGHGPWLWVSRVASMGHGIPFALAAKLARPDEPSFALMGDGAVGWCIMELDTAMRHNLPIVVVVANDLAWGSELLTQEQVYGRFVGQLLRRECRYDKIAQAMGAYGELVENPDEIVPAIQRALKSGLPALLNVMVSRTISNVHLRLVEIHGKEYAF